MSRSLAALRGRIGAYRLHALHGNDTAQQARAAFFARFEAEVDPERRLSADERHRRAVAARKAYMAQLAYRSAAARARPGAEPKESA